MALELAPNGILVNAIAPGSTLTEVTRKLFYGEDGSFQRPRPRHASRTCRSAARHVEEIAAGALFLAAPENSYVNGHSLTIDGGWTVGFNM